MTFPQRNLGIFIDHTNNFHNRNSISLGVLFEWQIGHKASPWHLNFQHNMGINNSPGLYIRTSLGVIGLFKLFEYSGDRPGNDNNYLLYSFLLPCGVTYYFDQKRDHQSGVFCNPLGYEYWQLKDGKEISASNIELGAKHIYYFTPKNSLYLSLGFSYQISIGSKALLPGAYHNGIYSNFRVAYTWHF